MRPDSTGGKEDTPMGKHTEREMMAISAGRLIKDGDILFAGTGVSMLAATVSKKIHAPRGCLLRDRAE